MGGGILLWANVSLMKRAMLYGYGRMKSYEYRRHRRWTISISTNDLPISRFHTTVNLLVNIPKNII